MLKLNASYSKKVPAEQEYSSQSYHAALEVELGTNLTEGEIVEKIHNTFEIVKRSVENEISGKMQVPNQSNTRSYPIKSSSYQQNGNNIKSNQTASNKQIKYLLDLARQKGIQANQLAQECGVNTVYDISKGQCSKMIDELQSRQAA